MQARGEDDMIKFADPASINEDPLREALREQAEILIQQSVEIEADSVLQECSHLIDERGRRRFVRNGYMPERYVETGVGKVLVRQPRVHDRSGKIRISSLILPQYLRKIRQGEDQFAWLFLKGLSDGDFSVALSALVGRSINELPGNIGTRLRKVWVECRARWQTKQFGETRYRYLYAGGIYNPLQKNEARDCILVIVGATANGGKEILAICDGCAETESWWAELLADLKQRGLADMPELAITNGGNGFFDAVHKIFDSSESGNP
jgi:putative transposase